MTNINRSSVKIGDVSCDVFTDGEGYFYSQTSLASLINKSHVSVVDFLKSKWLKDNQGEGCSVGYFPEFIENHGTNGMPVKIKLIDCDTASKYVIYHSMKGNQLALNLNMALMSESFQIRALSSFEEVSQNVLDIQAVENEEVATRNRIQARDLHNLYQLGCQKLGFSPMHCHEYITLLVFGQKASEARLKPKAPYTDKVWDDATIGVNHHVDPLLMEVYRKVKNRFLAYRKGTYKERIRRAFNEVTKDMKLG